MDHVKNIAKYHILIYSYTTGQVPPKIQNRRNLRMRGITFSKH